MCWFLLVIKTMFYMYYTLFFRFLVPTRTPQLIIMVCLKLLWPFRTWISIHVFLLIWIVSSGYFIVNDSIQFNFCLGARTAQSIVDSGLNALKSLVSQRLSGGGKSGSGRGKGGKQVLQYYYGGTLCMIQLLKAIEDFSVFIYSVASSKHEGFGRIRDSYAVH